MDKQKGIFMFSAVQIYQYIETKCALHGVSKRKMLAESGLSKGVMDNMKNGSMFGGLAKYKSLDYYKEHPLIEK